MLIMFAWSLPLLTLLCPGSHGVIASLLLFALAHPLRLALRLNRVISCQTQRCVIVCLLLLACPLLSARATHGATLALPALLSPTLSTPSSSPPSVPLPMAPLILHLITRVPFAWIVIPCLVVSAVLAPLIATP